MTSVREIPDFLSSAASEAQSLHGLLHSLDNGGAVQDEPGYDDMVVSHAIVDRFLRSVKGEAIDTVAQVFDVREARYIGVLHDGRFCEIDAHPGGSLCSYECSPLRERSKHIGPTSSIHFDVTKGSFSQPHDNHSSFVSSHGERAVNALEVPS